MGYRNGSPPQVVAPGTSLLLAYCSSEPGPLEPDCALELTRYDAGGATLCSSSYCIALTRE